MPTDWLYALAGGTIIGLSVSIMLLFNGRVAGISGIVSGLLIPQKGDTAWRLTFVLGLLSGGVILTYFKPECFQNTLKTSTTSLILAGFLVGFGTLMGSGCTSGHGVCGVSRMSKRSFLATLTFILAGIITVFILKNLGVIE